MRVLTTERRTESLVVQLGLREDRHIVTGLHGQTLGVEEDFSTASKGSLIHS